MKYVICTQMIIGLKIDLILYIIFFNCGETVTFDLYPFSLGLRSHHLKKNN